MTKNPKRPSRKTKPADNPKPAFKLARGKTVVRAGSANQAPSRDHMTALNSNAVEARKRVSELPQHTAPELIPQVRSESEPPVEFTTGTGGEPSPSDASNNTSPPATPIVPDVPTNDPLRNGDEADARMEEIEKILDHAATQLLRKCELVAEWVRHAEAKVGLSDNVVAKPQGGRPESGITRAARELPAPGKTFLGRRKYIERAIKIDSIWPEAKSAASTAGLGNIKCALFAIADEHPLEAQLAKVREISTRKAIPRRKAKVATEPDKTDGTNLQSRDAFDAPELTPTSYVVLNAEEEAHLAIMRSFWRRDEVLPREEWDRASRAEQRSFIREDMLGMPIREPRENMQDEAIGRPAGSAAETFPPPK